MGVQKWWPDEHVITCERSVTEQVQALCQRHSAVSERDSNSSSSWSFPNPVWQDSSQHLHGWFWAFAWLILSICMVDFEQSYGWFWASAGAGIEIKLGIPNQSQLCMSLVVDQEDEYFNLSWRYVATQFHKTSLRIRLKLRWPGERIVLSLAINKY